MSDSFAEGHYVLGIEGLALLRAGAGRRLEGVEERVSELEHIVGALEQPPYSARRDLPEREVEAGYAAWSESYDEPGNELVALEEPLVRALLDDLPAGPVLDAACGTARHAAYLAQSGREVTGVDASEAMLARAREKLPYVDLRLGALTDLPADDGAFAGCVCALALSHLPRLGPAIGELGRVLRPGGRLVISNPHPLATGILGWRAVFTRAGERSTIHEYPHRHGDYVAAFAAGGLTVRRLLEPGLSSAQARARAKAGHGDAFEAALTGLPALIVWEAERR